MKATELEFLKYLYDNMPVEDLWDLEEGFKADTNKELPEGYEPTLEEQTGPDGFWDDEPSKEDCSSCPHAGECANKKDE
jgi:hypothetical protein